MVLREAMIERERVRGREGGGQVPSPQLSPAKGEPTQLS